MYFSSPIIRNGVFQWHVIGGPFVMTSAEDHLDYKLADMIPPDADRQAIHDAIAQIPMFGTDKSIVLADQMRLCAMLISGSLTGNMTPPAREDTVLSPEHHWLHEDGGMDNRHFKPYIVSSRKDANEQRKLLRRLSVHEAYQARILMNEIMAHTLFLANKNIDFIKWRIPEFLMLLFKSALQNGALSEDIELLKQEVYENLDELDCIEDIIQWLNHMCDRLDGCILTNKKTKHAEIINKSLEYIREHYSEKVALNDVAEYVYLSPTYLSKIIKNETGHSFKSYLNRVRIVRSKVLMPDQSMTIAEIAYRVGFDNQSYFSKVFKKYEGVSPYHYRTIYLSADVENSVP